MSEIERLAAALREAREVRRVSEGAMQEAECALSQAIGDEFSAKAALDKAVAKLVNG